MHIKLAKDLRKGDRYIWQSWMFMTALEDFNYDLGNDLKHLEHVQNNWGRCGKVRTDWTYMEGENPMGNIGDVLLVENLPIIVED